MTSEELRKHLDEAPFIPFTIFTANGKSFKVDHPDFAMLTRGGRILILGLEDDSTASIDVMLATHIETHPTGSTSDVG